MPIDDVWITNTAQAFSATGGASQFHIHREADVGVRRHLLTTPSLPHRMANACRSAWRRLQGGGEQPQTDWNMAIQVVRGRGVVHPDRLFANQVLRPIPGSPNPTPWPATVAEQYMFRPGAPGDTRGLPAEVREATGARRNGAGRFETVRLADVGRIEPMRHGRVVTYEVGHYQLTRSIDHEAPGAVPSRKLVINAHGASAYRWFDLPTGSTVHFMSPHATVLWTHFGRPAEGWSYASVRRDGHQVAVRSGSDAATSAVLNGNLKSITGSRVPGRARDLNLRAFGQGADIARRPGAQREQFGHAFRNQVVAEHPEFDVLTVRSGHAGYLSEAVDVVTRQLGLHYDEIFVNACRGTLLTFGEMLLNRDRNYHANLHGWTAAARPAVETVFQAGAPFGQRAGHTALVSPGGPPQAASDNQQAWLRAFFREGVNPVAPSRVEAYDRTLAFLEKGVMPDPLGGPFGTKGLPNLQAIAAIAGPEAFLEGYRTRLQGQGLNLGPADMPRLAAFLDVLGTHYSGDDATRMLLLTLDSPWCRQALKAFVLQAPGDVTAPQAVQAFASNVLPSSWYKAGNQDRRQWSEVLAKAMDAVHPERQRALLMAPADPSSGLPTVRTAIAVCGKPALAQAIGQQLAEQGVAVPAAMHAGLHAFVDFLEGPGSAQADQVLNASLRNPLCRGLLRDLVLGCADRPGLAQRMHWFAHYTQHIGWRHPTMGIADGWAHAALDLIGSPAMHLEQQGHALGAMAGDHSAWVHMALENDPGRSGIQELGKLLARLPLREDQKIAVLFARSPTGAPALLELLRGRRDDVFVGLDERSGNMREFSAAQEDASDGVLPARRTPAIDGMQAFSRIVMDSGLSTAGREALLHAILTWGPPGGPRLLDACVAERAPGDPDGAAARMAVLMLGNMAAEWGLPPEAIERLHAATPPHRLFDPFLQAQTMVNWQRETGMDIRMPALAGARW
jgi:hypothetical protein